MKKNSMKPPMFKDLGEVVKFVEAYSNLDLKLILEVLITEKKRLGFNAHMWDHVQMGSKDNRDKYYRIVEEIKKVTDLLPARKKKAQPKETGSADPDQGRLL